MEDQQGDYEYYTQRADNTPKYILTAIAIVAVMGGVIWLLSRNWDLSAENQRLQTSSRNSYTTTNYEQSAVAPASYAPDVVQPNPQEDLKVTFDVHSNLVAVPIIKGSVFNASTRTAYKNVVISVSYYTEGYDLIGRENITTAYLLQPGQITELRHKPDAKAYRKAKHFRLHLLEATPQ